MFPRLLLIPVLFAALSPQPSQAQTSKEEFLDALKKAFSHDTETERIAALTGLYYFDPTRITGPLQNSARSYQGP